MNVTTEVSTNRQTRFIPSIPWGFFYGAFGGIAVSSALGAHLAVSLLLGVFVGIAGELAHVRVRRKLRAYFEADHRGELE